MKRLLLNAIVTCTLFASAAAAQALERRSVMHPDQATLLRWQANRDNAPRFVPNPGLADRELGPAPILLDHIAYTPSQRDQGSCGNGWVWAGTALMEINHSATKGVKDRLSVQQFDSCMYVYDSYDACLGGDLASFVSMYNAHINPIPWSNANAQFQDGSWSGGGPAVTCAGITLHPSYYTIPSAPNQMKVVTVATRGVGQAAAITNIKNALLQNKGVAYGFLLANAGDWDDFYDYWDTGAGTALWEPDSYCGHTWNGATGGAHMATIVGWNDDDAANPYWIVLNSWGITANRPTGLFRLRMNIDYDCALPLAGDVSYEAHTFQTLDVNFSDNTFALGTDTNSMWQAVKGGGSSKVFVRSRPSTAGISGPWSSWTDIGGSTSHAPALIPFNSRLYMIVKGVVSNKIWVRWMGHDKVWSPWVNITGSTSESPSPVVFRNRLYLFVKGNATGTIWYNSMNTVGVWDTWRQVPDWVAIAAPAAVVMNDELVLFEASLDNKIYERKMANPDSWGGVYVFSASRDLRTDRGLSAAVYDGKIVLVAKGDVGTISNNVSYITTTAGHWGTFYPWAHVPGGTTTERPQIAFGPKPGIFYVTALRGANKIWYNAYVSGDGWASTSGYNPTGSSTDTAAGAMYYWR